MADYYSHNDPHRRQANLDYETGSGSGWIWGGILAVAIIGLVALGMSGSSEGTGTETAVGTEAPAPVDPGAAMEVAPADDAAAAAGTVAKALPPKAKITADV